MMILLEFLRDYNGQLFFHSQTRSFVLKGQKGGKEFHHQLNALHVLDKNDFEIIDAITELKKLLD